MLSKEDEHFFEMLCSHMPQNAKQIVESLDQNIYKTIEFFAIFSRLEYALKHVEKTRNGKIGEEPEPNWDKFAKYLKDSLGEERYNDIIKMEAAQYLTKEPPRKQIIMKDGTLKWEPLKRAEKGLFVIFLRIRDVRNNLFHGGKYPSRKKDRDRLDACLKILYACLEYDNDVTKKFKENE